MKELVYFWERGTDTPLAGKGYKLNARFKSFHFEPYKINNDIIAGEIELEENENFIRKFSQLLLVKTVAERLSC